LDDLVSDRVTELVRIGTLAAIQHTFFNSSSVLFGHPDGQVVDGQRTSVVDLSGFQGRHGGWEALDDALRLQDLPGGRLWRDTDLDGDFFPGAVSEVGTWPGGWA